MLERDTQCPAGGQCTVSHNKHIYTHTHTHTHTVVHIQTHTHTLSVCICCSHTHSTHTHAHTHQKLCLYKTHTHTHAHTHTHRSVIHMHSFGTTVCKPFNQTPLLQIVTPAVSTLSSTSGGRLADHCSAVSCVPAIPMETSSAV